MLGNNADVRRCSYFELWYSGNNLDGCSNNKVQVYFALLKLIQYKMAYRISRLTNNKR